MLWHPKVGQPVGRPMSHVPLPPFAESLTPPLQHFILFSPSPFPNSRNGFHIHLRRVQWRATVPQLHFMFLCLTRSGWRKTRFTCQRTCVSVCLQADGGWGGEEPTECRAQQGGSQGEALGLRWCPWDMASRPGIFGLHLIMALKSLTFLSLISQYFHSYLIRTWQGTKS